MPEWFKGTVLKYAVVKVLVVVSATAILTYVFLIIDFYQWTR